MIECKVLFKEGDWQIRMEFRSDRGIQSYIYHGCGAKSVNIDGSGEKEFVDGGWCSCWDVRKGECYYCKMEIPEHIKTIWLMLEGDRLGSYMLDKEEPWKAPGRPS
jgi:hypothetical protein